MQSSAIAITLGLVVAYFACVYTNGTKGISDIAIFSGFALLGGAMIRDLAIASTAFEVDVKEVNEVLSPLYDLGFTEKEIKARWKKYYLSF